MQCVVCSTMLWFNHFNFYFKVLSPKFIEIPIRTLARMVKSSIYFFYRFSSANSIYVCNVLFVVECCDSITLVSTLKLYLQNLLKFPQQHAGYHLVTMNKCAHSSHIKHNTGRNHVESFISSNTGVRYDNSEVVWTHLNSFSHWYTMAY
jgi:hypothetical protein